MGNYGTKSAELWLEKQIHVPAGLWALEEITARFTGLHNNCSGNKRGNWRWLP